MAYSGRFIPNNLKKYRGNPDKVFYRSLWELQTFRWCDLNPDIKSWCSEEIIIPYISPLDGKYHRYFCDLLIEFNTGFPLLVEIKPRSQTMKPKIEPGKRKMKKTLLNEALTYEVNEAKWTAAVKYAEERGWKFQVWTEVTLEKRGILTR